MIECQLIGNVVVVVVVGQCEMDMVELFYCFDYGFCYCVFVVGDVQCIVFGYVGLVIVWQVGDDQCEGFCEFWCYVVLYYVGFGEVVQ